MAPQRTFRQRYFLFVIGGMRWSSLLVAGFAVVIVLAWLPTVLASQRHLLPQLMLNGVAFCGVGAGLYFGMTYIEQAYRRRLDR